jgi:polyhydroxybutyrate depolymerase
MHRSMALALGAIISLASCKRAPQEPSPSQHTSNEPARRDQESGASGSPRSGLTTAPTASAAVERLAAELHVPKDVKSDERLPLVVLLHGLGASAEAIEKGTDWPRFLEAQRAAWVAPNGPQDRAGRRFWDAGPSCCNFDRLPVDHVAQIGELITRALAEHPIDPKRVFVGGISNGGFMAHRLGCELRSLVRGVVSIAGAGPASPASCPAGAPIRVLQIHGTADDIVAYGGGHLFGKTSYPEHVSAEKTVADWAARLGCGKPKSGEPLDFEAKLPDSETKVTRFENCRAGRVELWTVDSGSHYIGFRSPSQEAIWRFLNP